MTTTTKILVAASPGHVEALALRAAIKFANANDAHLTVLDVVAPLPRSRKTMPVEGRDVDIEALLPRACSTAGLHRAIQWHVLRHTFARRLVMRGEPLKMFQELLGHANIEATMITTSSLAIAECANHERSLDFSSGGGGNRTSGDTPGSDDSRMVSRTGIDENTVGTQPPWTRFRPAKQAASTSCF